ncbi:MAG: SAM-dependent methyltransferase, partial [Syntrophorhabdales bacterium]
EGPIRWITSLDRLGAVDGFTFVVANEFFDALPFHRVIRQKGRIEEIYVGCGDGFFDRTGPLSTDVASFIRKYPIFLQENQVSEVTTAAEPLIGAISGLVERGCLLIFDYGYHQADIAAGRFFHGSMVGYKERVMREDVFDSLGQMDITHHVNFDHLSALLGEKGWRKDGEIEQYRFLCNAGMLEALAGLGQGERISAKWLINPEGLGSMISVLGFSRNLPQTLPGFRRAG